MSGGSKFLVVIFIIQAMGLFILSQAFSNIKFPDESALTIGRGKVFQGDDETRFIMAVSQIRSVPRTVNFVIFVSSALCITTALLTCLALVSARRSERHRGLQDRANV